MLGFAWLAIRQAQEAIDNGRLEDAQRLLTQGAIVGHRRQPGLLADLATAFARRGEKLFREKQTEAAWRDLLQAEMLQKANPATLTLRRALIQNALSDLRDLLAAADPDRAEQLITRYQALGVASPELDQLHRGSRIWNQARELADQGEFALAQELTQQLTALLPTAMVEIVQFRQKLQQRQETCSALLQRLDISSNNGCWSEVIDLAGQVLALAPQHAEARRLRSQAWRAVEPATLPGLHSTLVEYHQAVGVGGPAPRYLLWIDGIGGFLICLGNRLTLGQAGPTARVDIPLAADISRLHTTLTRDSEGWMVESLRPMRVNARPITQTLLRSEDRITLGASCQMLFRQSVPVSQSAQLDLTSGHRLPLALDGVILMADTLVLDGGPQAHITIPGLVDTIVLFRSGDQLGIRHKSKLVVNGTVVTNRYLLPPTATVVAGDLSFTLEPAEPRLGDGGDEFPAATLALLTPGSRGSSDLGLTKGNTP